MVNFMTQWNKVAEMVGVSVLGRIQTRTSLYTMNILNGRKISNADTRCTLFTKQCNAFANKKSAQSPLSPKRTVFLSEGF